MAEDSTRKLLKVFGDGAKKGLDRFDDERVVEFAQRLGKDINVILPQNAIPIEL